MAAPVVAFRPGILSRVAAGLHGLMAAILIAVLIAEPAAPWYLWLYLVQAPVWILVMLRSEVVVANGSIVARRGFGQSEQPLKGVVATLRRGTIRLERNGRLVAAASALQATFVNGQPTSDAEVTLAALRHVILDAEAIVEAA